MSAMREYSVPIPQNMRSLPVDPRTRHVVPWFVAWVDGLPDFRVIGPDKIYNAVRFELCWLCGRALAAHKYFVVGPMCAVNRISAEPPSHRDCALFAAKVCPFLAMPKAARRDANVPEAASEPAGLMIRRNPGVVLLWHTKSFALVRASNGVLFRMGEPVDVAWLAEGRRATRAEVVASIESGYPILEEAARRDGPRAVRALEAQRTRVDRLLPPAVEAAGAGA